MRKSVRNRRAALRSVEHLAISVATLPVADSGGVSRNLAPIRHADNQLKDSLAALTK